MKQYIPIGEIEHSSDLHEEMRKVSDINIFKTNPIRTIWPYYFTDNLRW